MAQPYWVTNAGSLGTIQELEFYNLQLEGRDPEEASNNTGLTFSLLAGSLPAGIAMSSAGVVDGIPTQRSLLKGIPYEVSENVTSTFVVRITDAENLVADRTFSLTVAGPDSPVWSTASGRLLDTHDGEEVNLSIAATDSDGDDLVYTITNGNLPPGLVLNSSTGAITGRVGKTFPTSTFNFDVRVTDGLHTIDRRFTIKVHALGQGRVDRTQDADLVNITADSTSNMWLADTYLFARPWMVTTPSSMESFRQDNYYIETFKGAVLEDIGNIQFEKTGNFPSFLTFDGAYEINTADLTGTSLVYGTVPATAATETKYSFSIRPKITWTDNDYTPSRQVTIYGKYVEYTLTIRGDSNIEVTWS